MVDDMNIEIIGGKVNNDYLDNIMTHYGSRSYINMFTRTPLMGLDTIYY